MSPRAAYQRLALCVALAGVMQGCAEPRAQAAAAAECRARIVVGFVASIDTDGVARLAAASDVRLAVVSRLLPDLYVLDLAANGADAACIAALDRVRNDPSVRSAELDSRRAPNSG
jgi:hypothetical protein